MLLVPSSFRAALLARILGPCSGCPPAAPQIPKARSLPVAVLLAASGGSLDAFVYLAHGKVFAGAMTGNAVLAGVALLSQDRREALRHLLPIATFLAGLVGARWLNARTPRTGVQLGLLAEITGLLLLSLVRHVPETIFVPAVSMLVAYQIATFRQVDEFTFNSTFITANLRTMMDGLWAALQPRQRREGLRQARDMALIVGCFVGCFVGGAAASALVTPHAGNRTLWLPASLLLAVLLLLERRPEDAGAPESRQAEDQSATVSRGNGPHTAN